MRTADGRISESVADLPGKRTGGCLALLGEDKVLFAGGGVLKSGVVSAYTSLDNSSIVRGRIQADR